MERPIVISTPMNEQKSWAKERFLGVDYGTGGDRVVWTSPDGPVMFEGAHFVSLNEPPWGYMGLERKMYPVKEVKPKEPPKAARVLAVADQLRHAQRKALKRARKGK